MALLSNMRGTEEAERSNPSVQSKFDKSKGMGLKPPHLSHPGQTAPVTNDRTDRVRMEPKNVDPRQGNDSLHKVTVHHPSTLGSGMAEGRGYAREPNINQTDQVGKSHTLSMDRFAGHEPDPVRAGADKHSKQHPTESENPRMGGAHPDRRSAGKQVYGGERVSRGSTKQGPGVLHANKRGSGPNLK